MRNLPMAMLVLISLGAANALAATSGASGQAGGADLTADEQQRMHQLQDRLCQRKELNCENITALFADPRLTIYQPPEPAPEETTARTKKTPQRNPYLTERFGLLTPESLATVRSNPVGAATALRTRSVSL